MWIYDQEDYYSWVLYIFTTVSVFDDFQNKLIYFYFYPLF